MSSAQPVQLTDILDVLRRRARLVAALCAVGLLLGVLAWVLLPQRYTATTSVEVAPLGTPKLSAETESGLSMATETELAQSSRVAEQASADIAGSPSSRAVRDATEVENPTDSTVLSFTYTAHTPEQAAAGADAVAESYLDVRGSDAAEEIDGLLEATGARINALQRSAAVRPAGDPLRSSFLAQIDDLSSRAAALSNLDADPGRSLGAADVPSGPSTPGLLPLALAGLVLGFIVAVPVAMLRRDPEPTPDIGGVHGLSAPDDSIVLDGTMDADRAETWDIAAIMLKLPSTIPPNQAYTIMVDATPTASGMQPGSELVEALARRGRTARLVEASVIADGKISRGWPTDRKMATWGGEVVVIDSTGVTSDANRVQLASRCDQVVLARTSADDADVLRRLRGLLKANSIDIALTVLFPHRAEVVRLSR